jgi:pre-mRNA-splicing factor ATP-dependent RNA helicase DHX15/PRP43
METINKNIDDILDSKGKNKNFLNDKEYSKEYKEVGEKWSMLPMYSDKESTKKFFKLHNENMVMLLISGTGSGKTVLVPKYVLKYNKTLKIPGKIAVTNPKTLTTVYNAEYACKTLDVNMGEEVGYKFKGSPSDAVSDKTELIYLTDGLLLAKILGGDKTLKEFNTVIIDEAHERGVQIDLLLKFLKEILLVRKDFKLIIMSATINAEVFKNY